MVKKKFIYFIGYKDYEKAKPLCIMPPKMSEYMKCFIETNCILFLIENEKCLEAYINIWDKVNNIMQK